MNPIIKNATTGIVGALATVTVGPDATAKPVLTWKSTGESRICTVLDDASNGYLFDSLVAEGYVVGAPTPLRSAIAINELSGKVLSRPISVLVEPDEDMFLARSPDIPQIFGHADSPGAALDSLVDNIEGLWEDLNSDDNFTDEWLLVKDYLSGIVEG